MPPAEGGPASSLVRRSIDRGHRRLLKAFREFGLHDESRGPPEADALRGAAAFVEQEVPLFARWETDRLPPGDLREVLAFEHAFLQGEIDAFARAARRLLALLEAGPLFPQDLWEEVRRRAARVEAVLELHAQHLRDDTLEWPVGSAGGARHDGADGESREGR